MHLHMCLPACILTLPLFVCCLVHVLCCLWAPVLAVSWCDMWWLTQRKQLTAPGSCLVLAGPGGERLGASRTATKQGFISPPWGLMRFHLTRTNTHMHAWCADMLRESASRIFCQARGWKIVPDYLFGAIVSLIINAWAKVEGGSGLCVDSKKAKQQQLLGCMYRCLCVGVCVHVRPWWALEVTASLAL